MLGTKAKPAQASPKPAAIAPSTITNENLQTCVVAKDTRIEGYFISKEHVRLDGTAKGEFHCTNRLVMGVSGRFEGKLLTQDAIVMGTIEGDLIVKGTLHLKNTANISGTITAKYLIVDEGAKYEGECKIGNIDPPKNY